MLCRYQPMLLPYIFSLSAHAITTYFCCSPPFDSSMCRGPAIFGISWDAGNASKRRSYTPIIVSVGNTDSASSETCTCIGYLPTLPDSVGVRNISDARRVLVQRCIGAILKVVNDCAKRGFTCTLRDIAGDREKKWHLYAVLARTELDTKERYKFFGCARQRACPIGSGPRKGRSIFRQCTPHATRKDMPRKRQLASREDSSPDCVAAKESLLRRGCHPTISCPAVLEDCRDAILPVPARLFAGLCAYDVMHTIYIGAVGYLLEAVLDLVTPSLKRQLDSRTVLFSPFRDKNTGSLARRAPKVTRLAYLTAEQHVRLDSVSWDSVLIVCLEIVV